ncbi:MAG: helix-turn-helix transcriptional regulator [Steroidobacteraceae bacterium]
MDMSTALFNLLEHAHRALPLDASEASAYLTRARDLLANERAEPPPAPVKQPLKSWQVTRVDRLIQERLDIVRIDELASAARLSRSHFSRSFRTTLGITPISYLRRRRVERAQQLMLTTRRSLSQIALDCGMSDQSHMTRVFRAVLGTTPAAWRRQNADMLAQAGAGATHAY